MLAAGQRKSSWKSLLSLASLVDPATLTGAIVVALSNLRAGLFTNNQPLADLVLKAGERSGERFW